MRPPRSFSMFQYVFDKNLPKPWRVKGLIATRSNLVVFGKVRPKMGIITSWPIGPFGEIYDGLFLVSLAIEFCTH